MALQIVSSQPSGDHSFRLGAADLALRSKDEVNIKAVINPKASRIVGGALSAEIPAICLAHRPRQDPYTATMIK